MSPDRKRRTAGAKRRHRGDLVGRKPEPKGVVLFAESQTLIRFDHGVSLWLGMAQQSIERDSDNLIAEGLLHRWGVEPGTLHLRPAGRRYQEQR